MIPSLLGLIVLMAGLVMIHYGLTETALPLTPIVPPVPISKLGSVTSTQ